MGGDDDRLALRQAGIDDLRLHLRQPMVIDLDAQIAARDHQRIGLAHNLLQVPHAGLILDLRDDPRLGAQLLEQSSSAPARPPPCARRRARKNRPPPRRRRARPGRSFSVSAGRFTSTPGRLICRREPSLPGRQDAAMHGGLILRHHLEPDQPAIHQHHAPTVTSAASPA